MAPVALLRCCTFWGALFAYGTRSRGKASGAAQAQRVLTMPAAQACSSPSQTSFTRTRTDSDTQCLCPSPKQQPASSCGAADTRRVENTSAVARPRLTPRLRRSSPSPALPTWLLLSGRLLLPTLPMKSCVSRAAEHAPWVLTHCFAFGAGGQPPVVHGHHGLRRRLRALLRGRAPRPAGLAHRGPRGSRVGGCRRRSERHSRERALGREWRSQRRSGEAKRARSCAGSTRRAAWLGLGAAACAGFPGGHHRRRRLLGHLPQRRLCRGASLPCVLRECKRPDSATTRCQGTPVLPVTLRYSVPSGFNLCWAGPLGTGAHFWKTMCAWGKHVEVDILPLHRPSAAELADGACLSRYACNVCRLTLPQCSARLRRGCPRRDGSGVALACTQRLERARGPCLDARAQPWRRAAQPRG